MKLPIAVAAWLVVPACALVYAKPAEVGATVYTSSGPVSGHAARNRTQVSEYLGIPYAVPPVGQLRFAPPEKYSSSTPFNASSFSPDCPANPSKPFKFPNATPQEPSIVAYFAGGKGNPMSEDCLTLNVWTKPSKKKNKPVLLWFYGGRFNLGDTNTPFYIGQYLADAEDVVVVTINYRVNIFGFPGYPGLPQNVGLLDQRLAVEWIRDNIAGFDGCPGKITLFGQSAGGASVDYYSYIWKDNPIVKGLISESGTALSFNPYTPAHSSAAFYNASTILGCGSSGDVLACVRSKNTTAVLAAIAKIPPQPSKALPPPVFQPTIDNITVFADYTSRPFAKIPYLAGNNAFEFGYYGVAAAALNKTFTPYQKNVFDLEAFTCPTGASTALRAVAGVPVWRYRYFADWDNLRLYPGSGAYHGSEIHMIFGGAQDVSGIPNSEPENELSAYMMKAWAAFAEDPRKGLSTKLGWPMYNPTCDTLVQLGLDGATTASYVKGTAYDGECAALGVDKSAGLGAF